MLDSLIDSYADDLRRERRKCVKPTVYGRPTRADLRALRAHNKRMLQLVDAAEHLAFARRMNAQGRPQRVVREVLKSAQRCLHPVDREQRSRETLERWTVPAQFNVDRPRNKPKSFRGDLYNDYDW